VIEQTPLDYRHDNTDLQGIMVRDTDVPGDQPGVLLIHEFMGIGEYLMPHANRLAEAGYAVLLCDMFGKGVRPHDASHASQLTAPFKADRLFMRSRTLTGLAALAGQDCVDSTRLFALGLSFGGCCALELARSGAPLTGTISIYGYLNTPFPAQKGSIPGRILVLHGMGDRVVPMDEAREFCDEMHRAALDCRITMFSNAGHGFCNRTVRPDETTGNAYCAQTEQRAWKEIINFLEEAETEKNCGML